MNPSREASACRWLGLTGSVMLAAGGLTSGALPVAWQTSDSGLGLVCVYFGLVLLIGAWWRLGRNLPPGKEWLLRTLALWVAPLAIGPPLFSRDVYSYLAQGAMVVAGVDVYEFGPAQLGGPLADEVPAIWQHTPAPYGPVFLRLAAGVAWFAEADVVAGVVGLRVVALLGLAALAYFVPRLAGASGVEPGPALWLGVLNPLVLLHFVSGAHNDAVMMGLLVMGLTFAATGGFAAGAALVSVAGLVKAPAAAGLLAIAWYWVAATKSWSRAAIGTVGVALGVGVAVTLAAGTGYGWMSALDTPISATNWSLSSALGRLSGDVPLWRWIGLSIGLAAAGVAAVFVWLRRISPVYALGLSLAGLALLGPATRPWYLLWGLIPIAAAAPDGATRRWSAILCAIFAIVVLPDGYPPTVTQLALAVLGGGLAAVTLWGVGAKRFGAAAHE